MASKNNPHASNSLFDRMFGRSKVQSSQSIKAPSQLFKRGVASLPQFPKLPVELQIRIWEEYIQLPPKGRHKHHTRLYLYGYEKNPEEPTIQARLKWTTCVDVAAALRVCHLSRELAIRYCLSLVPVSDIECPYEEQMHLSDFGHKLPQFGDPSTAPSKRSYADLVTYKEGSLLDASAMPCITPQTALGTVRYLIVGEEYLKRKKLKAGSGECGLDR